MTLLIPPPHPPAPRPSFPLRRFRLRRALGAGLLGVALGGLTGAVPLAAAQPLPMQAAAAAPAAGRPTTGFPPLRLAGSGAAAAPAVVVGPGILRVSGLRGEVELHRKSPSGPTSLPLQTASVLLARDELVTDRGSVELTSPTGSSLTIGKGSLVALLGPTAVYLARGELHLQSRLPAGTSVQGLPALMVATPCGRTPVKARDAWVRVDGDSTVVSVYDGSAFLGGYPPVGVPVLGGQSRRCKKGEPTAAVQPLLPAPTWPSGAELLLLGDGPASLSEVTLRWQGLPAAQRYRVELFRGEADAPPLALTSVEVPGPRPQAELGNLEVGSYLARVYAIGDSGAIGSEGPAHRLLIAKVSGLEADGTIHSDAGLLPRVSGPAGLPVSLLLDGQTAVATAPGAHQLRVVVDGLSAEAPMVVAGQLATTASEVPSEPSSEPLAPSAPPPLSNDPPPPSSTAALAEQLLEDSSPTASELPPRRSPSDGPEDVLLGGVGEVPLDGIRSPWAGKLLGARLETTMSGSLRLVAHGRWTMQNGFGFDASAALARVAISNLPDGYARGGFGNINAALRTPALRRPQVALQGIVNLVIPLSTSVLDTSIEVDPQNINRDADETALRPQQLPKGGGWRLEPALLLGVRVRNLTLSTMQGASLRMVPTSSAAYVGGLLIQAELVSGFSFLSFASWQVNYLGIVVNPGDSTPDIGGAVGGGFETRSVNGTHGLLRLALLGRIGLGDAGAAVYGRGTIAIQLGYLFR